MRRSAGRHRSPAPGWRAVSRWALMGVSVMSLLAHGASPGPEPDRRERPRTLALWSFDEGSGRVVYDRSGAVRPLDLRVGRAARWTGPGLSLRDGSALTSVRPARALLAVGRRGGVTVEMWLRPEAMPRSRPLLSLAKAGDSRRRVLLAAKTLPRLGTTVFARTGPAGSHSRRLVATAAPDRFAHLVWTRTAGGTESLFVDGRRAARAKVGRDPLPGAGRWRLVIGGGSGAGWQGELLRVKVLDRALRPAQVARDHRNEPVPPAPRPATSDRPLLIKHGWDMPSPGYVRDHIDEMERLPFDGLTIACRGWATRSSARPPCRTERFRDALAPLALDAFRPAPAQLRAGLRDAGRKRLRRLVGAGLELREPRPCRPRGRCWRDPLRQRGLLRRRQQLPGRLPRALRLPGARTRRGCAGARSWTRCGRSGRTSRHDALRALGERAQHLPGALRRAALQRRVGRQRADGPVLRRDGPVRRGHPRQGHRRR